MHPLSRREKNRSRRWEMAIRDRARVKEMAVGRQQRHRSLNSLEKGIKHATKSRRVSSIIHASTERKHRMPLLILIVNNEPTKLETFLWLAAIFYCSTCTKLELFSFTRGCTKLSMGIYQPILSPILCPMRVMDDSFQRWVEGWVLWEGSRPHWHGTSQRHQPSDINAISLAANQWRPDISFSLLPLPPLDLWNRINK